MKKIFITLVMSYSFCTIKSQVSSSYEWTWLGGRNLPNQFGHYGQKGVESPENMPGARYGSSKWIDKNDNLWLFGGGGFAASSQGALNDLWKFNPKTNAWTWISGDSTANSAGIYASTGKAGVPSGRIKAAGAFYNGGPGNTPQLFLFGGFNDNPNFSESWNDLWVFNINDNQWIWLKGDKNVNGVGVIVGTGQGGPYQGPVFNQYNTPMARAGATAWVSGDVFCIYSGQAGGNIVDDFWEWDITGNLGSSGAGTGWAPIYAGETGIVEVSQYQMGKPGDRLDATGFYNNADGQMYLFGGWGYGGGTGSAFNSLNDLWKTNFTTPPSQYGFDWKWISGDTVVSSAGSYGNLGVPSSSNKPPARWISDFSPDINGKFILFGGYSGQEGLNDVWSYDPSSNIWTWLGGGNNNGETSGIYGTKGVQSANNIIGTRQGPVTWITSNGDMYVFGGYSGLAGSLNDFWKFSKPIPVSASDSLALVDLYNNTGGANWTKNTNWLSTAPIGTWYGVNVVNGRVTSLYLDYNQLNGNIPTVIGNLVNLTNLDLSGNQLTGIIPSSLGNLVNVQFLVLDGNFLTGPLPASFSNLLSIQLLSISSWGNSHLTGTIPEFLGSLSTLESLWLDGNNFTGAIPASLGSLNKLQDLILDGNQLSGGIPTTLQNLNSLQTLRLDTNHFTFAGLEQVVQKFSFAQYSPQSNISISKTNNLLSVFAGGTLTNDTFRLFKNGVLIASQLGDSTFYISTIGTYFIAVSNAIAKQLTLYSDSILVNYSLADTTTTITQNFIGVTGVDINNGIYKIISATPRGLNPINGNVTATVTLNSTVSVYNGQPYLQRHYDITPLVNENNATASITLYFTQQEFDSYNNYVTTNNLSLPLLPTKGTDSGNILVTQFHGTGTVPGNYTGSTVNIIPTVTWNTSNNWWELTFPVNGFSGFYVSTANITLPLTLLKFTGTLQNKNIVLNWQTAEEINTAYFIIERSSDGNSFTSLGQINASGNSALTKNYSYLDQNPLKGINFYRLKMIDIDGKFSYSNIINVKVNDLNSSFKIFPNPANEVLNVQLSGINDIATLLIVDAVGRKLKEEKINVTNNTSFSINIKNLPKGIYNLFMKGKSTMCIKNL